MFEKRIVKIDKGVPISVLIEKPFVPKELKESKSAEKHTRIPCFVMGAVSHYHDKFSPAFQSAMS